MEDNADIRENLGAKDLSTREFLMIDVGGGYRKYEVIVCKTCMSWCVFRWGKLLVYRFVNNGYFISEGQAVVYYPPEFDPGRQYPLFVYV